MMAESPDKRLNESVTNPTLEAQIKKERTKSNERNPLEDYKKNRKPIPYLNRVTVYPDGTEVHYDSTPGYSCYEFRHSSGHVYQIADDGMETKISVGNVHDYKKEGYTLTIDQNGDITIGGHARISVGGGAHVEVYGDTNLVTTGDMNMYVGGNFNQTVAGEYNLNVTGPINTTTGGEHNQYARGNINTNAGANHNADVRGNYKMEAGGGSTMESRGNMTKKAPKIDLNP
jgi:hypothetical protein